jgi:hypothetical protein
MAGLLAVPNLCRRVGPNVGGERLSGGQSDFASVGVRCLPTTPFAERMIP